MKELADDRKCDRKKVKFVWGRIENIAGKEENDGKSHNDFKGYFVRVVKSQDCLVQS